MKKAIIFALVLSFVTQASILDKLKDTPATKYELGKFKLELFSFFVFSSLKDKNIRDSKFKYKSLNVVEKDKKLVIQATAIGKSAFLSQEQCSIVKKNLGGYFDINKISHDLWDNLSEKEYNQVINEMSHNVILIAEENENFKIEC